MIELRRLLGSVPATLRLTTATGAVIGRATAGALKSLSHFLLPFRTTMHTRKIQVQRSL
jgi:hypothetical protein